MTTNRSRRPSSGRASASALLDPPRRPDARQAFASAALRKEVAASTQRDGEAPEPEEVVVEPDLPVEEPAPTPAGPSGDQEKPTEALSAYEQMVRAMPPTEPVYLAGSRGPRLKVGDHTLQPGDIVPGAHTWPRLEAYERAGRVRRRD